MASTPTRMSRLVSGLPPVLLLLLLVVLFLGTLSGPAMADDQVLYSGSSLLMGQSLKQGNYALTMQRDCNLVLYNGGRAVWATNTHWPGGHDCRLTMQRNGNLVVYNGRGGALWHSGGNAKGRRGDGGNYALVLQRDGKLVIYGPSAIWTAGASTGAGVGGL